MRIALDLDGTLADIHSVFLDELEKREGIKYSFEDLETYYFEKAPFSVQRFHEIARYNWRNRKIPLTEPSIPEKLEKLARENRIDIVTARNDVKPEILENWLKSKDITYDSFVIDREKTHLDYDLLIDDSPTYLGEGMKMLLYSRPYNRRVTPSGKDRRVKNFGQVHRHVQKINR